MFQYLPVCLLTCLSAPTGLLPGLWPGGLVCVPASGECLLFGASSCFLSGCDVVFLSVIGQEPLSIIQLWRKFRSFCPDFVSSYAAYHHFRSMGWVPKGGGGAKYGVDFSKTLSFSLLFQIKYIQCVTCVLPVCVYSVVQEGTTFLSRQVTQAPPTEVLLDL